MLRVFVLLLLLANGGYYAWSQGLLQSLGYAPQRQGEPERLERQIRPELLRVLPAIEDPQESANAKNASVALAAIPAPAAVTSTTTAFAGECLEAGVFDADQTTLLRRAAAALPRGSWVLDATPLPGRWMVYIGRLADEEAVAKKRVELRALDVAYDRPGAALEPGLSLGRFSSEEGAQRSLVTLSNQGVHSARVVVERREAPGFTLRLPNADAALRRQVQALGDAMAGKPLRACV